MRAIIQRVSEASVRIEEEVIASIGTGWLVLLGITHTDTASLSQKLAEKIAFFRAFADESGKMNRSIFEVNGSILVVSNFTLYAETEKGRRPSFLASAPPALAEPLVAEFIIGLKAQGIPVQQGRFGAEMQVSLCNDGPVTFILELNE